MQIMHVQHSVKAFSKGNGIRKCHFDAKLNDSDVKFKIYYKYGNERFEHKFGLSLSDCTVNLQGTVLMHFETILKHAERLGYEI